LKNHILPEINEKALIRSAKLPQHISGIMKSVHHRDEVSDRGE
jgi:hypothetical protein